MNADIRIGFALCGSFCTFERVIKVLEGMTAAGMNVYPIMSEASASTDTRFGRAEEFEARLERACGRPVIKTIHDAEPIGPKKLLDVLIIAPCTGNTIGKLASGIADTSVTLAAKAHLRNERPIVIAVSSNDALAGNAGNIGALLNRRGYYFVPMTQDDPEKKPRSVVAKMELIPETTEAALSGRQIEPIIS